MRSMFKNILRKYSKIYFRVAKTNVYFHNFRNQRAPDCFDILTLKNPSETVENVCNRVQGILKINRNTPMEACVVRDINKLHYSWNYRIYRNGYGPKRNFKHLNKDSIISKYENILVNYHHSQYNEDYIIQKVFDRIGASNNYFVELGADDGQVVSNTVLLRYDGWRGLLIESGDQLPFNLLNATCLREFLTPDNVEPVFEKAGVPKEFDFLSIDIDGNDYYLWEALRNYKPRVLCIEVDGPSKNIRKLEPYNEENTRVSQCSILVMTELSEKKGYKLVYNNRGNAFYVNIKDYSRHFKPLKLAKWNEPYVTTVDLF